MAPSPFSILHVGDRSDYRDLIAPVSEAVWPEFMHHDAVAVDHWDGLFERFAMYQFALHDTSGNAIAGICNSVPLAWAGDPNELPEGGWDWALIQSAKDWVAGEAPTCLCAIQISVAPAYQGRGVSRRMVEAMRELAVSAGLKSMIAPVRPSLKGLYPLTSIDSFVGWKDSEGLPFDPWLRVHVRSGARIIKVCHRAMVITGTIAEWESWTQMRFPESGRYVVSGALVPVEVDLAIDRAKYVEPNVWVEHELGKMNSRADG